MSEQPQEQPKPEEENDGVAFYVCVDVEGTRVRIPTDPVLWIWLERGSHIQLPSGAWAYLFRKRIEFRLKDPKEPGIYIVFDGKVVDPQEPQGIHGALLGLGFAIVSGMVSAITIAYLWWLFLVPVGLPAIWPTTAFGIVFIFRVTERLTYNPDQDQHPVPVQAVLARQVGASIAVCVFSTIVALLGGRFW